MRARTIRWILILGLAGGLLFALTGSAAANPCFSELNLDDSIFLEEDTQTNCAANFAEVTTTTVAVGGSASASGPFSVAVGGNASATSNVSVSQTNNQTNVGSF